MTPLIVFVGFLGSGKTTFLRELLPNLSAAGVEPQVILNDYQNAGVDSFTLQEHAESVIPISGSCVCCGSREEMFDTLAAAELNPKTVMLMEANGTADAAQLIDLLTCDLRAVRYTLPWQLSVIDAKRWQRRDEHNKLEAHQLITATHFYLSHTEKQDSKRVSEVMASASHLNPKARWVSQKTFASEVAQLSTEAPNLPPRALRSSDDHDHDHDHDHGDHVTTHHFASIEFSLPDGLEKSLLETFLRSLPVGVIRAKGLVRLAGQEGEYTVFDYLGADQNINLRSYAARPHLAPLFLAIGPNLSQQDIQNSFTNLLKNALPSTQ